jgi:hypothetical protein
MFINQTNFCFYFNWVKMSEHDFWDLQDCQDLVSHHSILRSWKENPVII